MSDETLRPEATIDDIFRIAIKRESAAHHFYTEAAKWVHSKEARELLLRLASEEVEHETALTREWNHIKADRDVGRAMGGDM
jgi:rubrerythrin